jgi:poly(3-hydroxybutyrate) depolymerase
MMRHALLALLLLGACSTSTETDGGTFAPLCFNPPDGGVFVAGLAAPVAGCAAPAGSTGVLDLAALGWAPQGGVLVVPDSAPGTPLPVVFAFHGAGGTGADLRARLALDDSVDGGAILVYPNAIAGTWDITQVSPDGRRVDRLIGRLAASYCIDPSRIYISGFSAGAVFTLYLGCNVPQAFAGIAVVAGSDARFDTRCCTKPVSGIFIHGARDEAFSLAEGRAARAGVATRDQCSATTTPDGPHCFAYACPAPWAVDGCEWDGDHDIPDWAAAEMSRFFLLGP